MLINFELNSASFLSVMSNLPSSSDQICQFFDRGKYCKFGRRCKFLHIRRNRDNTTKESCSSKSNQPQKVVGSNSSLNVTHSNSEQPCSSRSDNQQHQIPVSSNLPSSATDSNTTQPCRSELCTDINKKVIVAGAIAPENTNNGKVCYYFSKFGRCKFGKRCRDEHIECGTPINNEKAHLIESEECNEVSCKDGGNNAASHRICKYYKSGYCSMGSRCRFRHPENLQLNTQYGQNPKRNRQQRRNQRFNPLLIDINESTDDQIENHGSKDISQLQKRYPKLEKEIDKNGTTLLQFLFVPSDPDWPYDVRSVPIVLEFPKLYPAERMKFRVNECQEIPPILDKLITRSANDWLTARYDDFKSKEKAELVSRALLKWLDRNLEDLFTTGLKQYQKELIAKAAGLEFVSASELKEQFENAHSSNTDSCDEEENDEDSTDEDSDGNDEDESDEDTSDEEDNSDDTRANLTSAQRGTEIRFQNLQLRNSLATILATKVCLIVRCERCRHTTELTTTANQANSVACGTCQSAQLVTFRPSMIHEQSAVLGHVDVVDCTVYDIVLLNCEFIVGCLSCSKEMPLQGLTAGQPKDTWCRSCNAKMRMLADSVKFLRLQPAVVDEKDQKLHKVPTKTKRIPKDPAIVDGKPLPNDGICKHYKKSFRWFRFPCCGKAYPCDICHDDKEDHEYTYANRMICGHCCKEQPYAAEKPCVRCSMSLTKKATTHWEGGKGCRDRIKMARDDAKKYSNLNKTVSRKSQGANSSGKKNTKLRHS